MKKLMEKLFFVRISLYIELHTIFKTTREFKYKNFDILETNLFSSNRDVI